MEYLVLGPAGMGIFAILGSIVKYKDDIKNVKEISGSSAGAVLALALALELPLNDILDRLLSLDFENFTKYKIKNFVTKFGFVNTIIVRKLLLNAIGHDPTFSELKRKVIISAYCLNRANTEYFSVDNHPDMKVIDAVCMSVAIPMVFAPVEFNGMLYIDGGTKEQYPITPFLEKKPDKIMCIQVENKEIYIENIENIKEYVFALMMSSARLPDTNTIALGKMVTLDIKREDMFNFKMNHEDKLRMYMKGSVS